MFLEKFQKLPSDDSLNRQVTHAIIECFLVPARNRLAVNPCTARRHIIEHQILWVFVEWPGGDEYPPGDVNLFGSILMILGF